LRLIVCIVLATITWRSPLVGFVCDWCRRAKKPGDTWILGFAAESISAIAHRQEVMIAERWASAQATHPLAVHFCSEEHKRRYVRLLFDTAAKPARQYVVGSESGRDNSRVSAMNSIGPAFGGARRETATIARRAKAKVVCSGFSSTDHIRSHGLSITLGDDFQKSSSVPPAEYWYGT
jgi:hypothetical protein